MRKGHRHLGGYDVTRDHHDLLRLSTRLRRLGYVHVHFVAVEVGIVGRCHAQIQSECGIRQKPHSMTLHIHTTISMSATESAVQDSIRPKNWAFAFANPVIRFSWLHSDVSASRPFWGV